MIVNTSGCCESVGGGYSITTLNIEPKSFSLSPAGQQQPSKKVR